MNGIKYLLDTCFIIRWQELQADAISLINQHNLQAHQCAYSVISHAEIFSWQGLNATDENSLKILLDDVVRLPVTDEVIERVIKIRKVHKIKLPDCLILATAKVHDLQLLTLDEKLKRIDKEIG